MKLNKREKRLFIILCILLFGFIYYRWIWIPQTTRLESVRIQELEVQEKWLRIQTLIQSEPDYDKKIQTLTNTLENHPIPFFTALTSEDVIRLYKEWTEEVGVQMDQMSFQVFSEEETEEKPAGHVLRSDFQFGGTYPKILQFLNIVNAYPKKIKMEGFHLQGPTHEDQMLVNGSLRFDSFPYIVEEKMLLDWENPFTMGRSSLFPSWTNPPSTTDDDDVFPALGAEDKDEEYDLENNKKSIEEKSKKPVDSSLLLYEFKDGSYFTVGKPKEVQGKIWINEKGVLVQYDFLRDIGYRRLYLAFDGKKPTILEKAKSVSIIAQEVSTNNHHIGMIIKDSMGVEWDITFESNTHWSGAVELRASLPEEVTYPVTIQRFYVETPENEYYSSQGKFLLRWIEMIKANEGGDL